MGSPTCLLHADLQIVASIVVDGSSIEVVCSMAYARKLFWRASLTPLFCYIILILVEQNPPAVHCPRDGPSKWALNRRFGMPRHPRNLLRALRCRTRFKHAYLTWLGNRNCALQPTAFRGGPIFLRLLVDSS